MINNKVLKRLDMGKSHVIHPTVMMAFYHILIIH